MNKQHPKSEAEIKKQQARFDKLLASLGQPDMEETKAFLANRKIGKRKSGLMDEMIAHVEAKIAESVSE